MKKEVIDNFVKFQLAGEATGHDYYHGKRVAELALAMIKKMPEADCDVAFAAGMVHDIIDEKICPDPVEKLAEVKNVLVQAGLSPAQVDEVDYIITHMSFSKNIEQRYVLSLAGQAVQDADRLESLGALGIARAFTYGGAHNNKIYDPAIEPTTLTSHDQYRNHEETTINHFYEKLFTLEDLMNTEAGKREARRRTIYMRHFIDEFMQEWDAKLE